MNGDVVAFDGEMSNQLQQRDPAAVAAAEQAKAEIQMSFMLAMSRPRDVMAARDRILASCRRVAFAELAEYSKPVSGRSVTGPSIRFAEEMIRCWTNVMVRTSVVFEDDSVRRVKVQCLDLESNTSYHRDVVVQKTVERRSVPKDREVLGSRSNSYGETVYICPATDDELHNKVAALVSKTIRNESLRFVPSDIVDEAMDVARQTRVDGDKADPTAALKKMVDWFSKRGVRPEHLAAYMGHSVDSTTVSELEELRQASVALHEGVTWAEVMEARFASSEGSGEAFQAKAEQRVEALKDRVAGRGKRMEPSAPGGPGEDPSTGQP